MTTQRPALSYAFARPLLWKTPIDSPRSVGHNRPTSSAHSEERLC
jgi:hypothetical protein